MGDRARVSGWTDRVRKNYSAFVPAIQTTHVEVHVFRRRRGRVEFLALRRSPDRRRLPGVWQPVTGRLEPGETAFEAAIRELQEETGLRPARWWGLETLALYFEAAANVVNLLPVFAAEVKGKDRVVLSEEHDDWRFVSAAQAGRLYLWEAQRRALEAVRREVLQNPKLAEALELDARRTRRTVGASRRNGTWPRLVASALAIGRRPRRRSARG